jgi:hypothetical protein
MMGGASLLWSSSTLVSCVYNAFMRLAIGRGSFSYLIMREKT